MRLPSTDVRRLSPQVITFRRPMSTHSDDDADERDRRAEELEDGSLDPDELDAEPSWWDEGSDDET